MLPVSKPDSLSHLPNTSHMRHDMSKKLIPCVRGSVETLVARTYPDVVSKYVLCLTSL